jgi:putative N6-adenine-specific DNA methylase
MTLELFAPCTLGLEPVLAAELRALGARDPEEGRGGVTFRGDRRVAYAANLWSRTAIRIQELLFRRPVDGPDALYEAVGSVPWEEHLDLRQTLAVDASVRDSAITHAKFAAYRVKDAIVDRFRRRTGARPSVDTKRPDLPLKLVVKKDVASLYRNLSGPSLHKRGWRPIQVKSPLSEALAAGLLLLSEWDPTTPLVDPMCGSGTFVVEAACIAADRAPGLRRRFAFERWPDHDAALWGKLRRDAERRARSELPFTIEGADRHGGAIELARRGAREAGVASMVRFTTCDVRRFAPGNGAGTAVVNPPYGERLGKGDDLRDSWVGLGNFLHARMGGGVAWVLSGNPELPRLLGLRADRRIPVKNGPIDCRWLRYGIRERG